MKSSSEKTRPRPNPVPIVYNKSRRLIKMCYLDKQIRIYATYMYYNLDVHRDITPAHSIKIQQYTYM